jgi:hypothetical protein
MPRHTKRLCSILGTSLIGLCLIASPAFAQGKGKKGKKSEEPAAQEEPASVDALMEDATKEKAKPKAKKGKRGKKEEPEPTEEEKKAAAEKAAEEQKAAEELAAADEWEKPPEEEAPVQQQAAKAPAAEEKHGDGLPISIGLLAGYGFMTDRRNTNLSTDPYGVMLKLRGGYTFDFGLYAGAYFAYFIGHTIEGGGGVLNVGDSETHASYMPFGLEVGYDWFVGPVIVRPSLEIGWAIGFRQSTGEPSRSINDFMLGPGLLIMYPMDEWFIGGDMRFSIVTGDGASGFVPAITAGLRF